MSDFLEKILVNKQGLIATAIAGFGSLIAEAWIGKIGYAFVFGLAAIVLFVGYLEEKKKAKLYKNGTVPVPIVINVGDNTDNTNYLALLVSEIEKNDEQFVDFQTNLAKYFNITEDMLMFKYDGDLYDNNRLISFLQIIRYELNDIQSRLQGNAHFHIFFLRRPAFGLAIGGMFSRDGIIVYQNNDSKNNIDRIATIDTRQYKESIDSYKHFKMEKSFNNKENQTLLIVIQVSSHMVDVNHRDFAHFENKLILTRIGNGTIPYDQESVDSGIWIEHAQELYNIINKIRIEFKHFTIAHSMPESLAIILGMGLDNYWDISVTQYEDDHYPEVINLKKIKYYF